MESDIQARAAQAIGTQARVHPANPLRDPGALVSPAVNWRETNETRLWCNEPGDEPGSGWHPQYMRYYHAARGETHYERDGKAKPPIPRTLCADCGIVAQIIDHIVQQVTARSNGGAKMLKARTPKNLLWLWVSCHNSKTGTGNRVKDPKGSELRPWQPSMF